jgi:hypothetical protein
MTLLSKPRKLSAGARKASLAAGVVAFVAAATLMWVDPHFVFFVVVLGLLGSMWLIHGIFGRYF